jgi:YVTN family beta-propeller protein
MIRRRVAGYAAVLAVVAMALGCGDTFRPTAIPVVTPGGDPSTTKHALVLSTNGAAAGALTNENVSGDTIVLQRNTGVDPVHATLIAAITKMYVANRGDDTVTAFTTFANLLTRTVSLPAGSSPVFVHTTENANVYVANSGSVASVCGGGGSVGVINVQQDSLTNSVCVNGAPVALAESVDGRKLYAVSPGTNSVTPIATQDLVTSAPVAVGNAPVWAVTGSDNRFLFVANSGDATVTVIDMSTDTVVNTIAVGTNPTFLLYDPTLRRVYVANTGGNSVSIIDAGGAVPALLTTVAVGSAPRSVTALADGSRAYVANSGSDTVSVINTNSNTVSNTIAVGDEPVSIASGLNSTRVIVANRAGSSISVIRTSDDSVVATHAAPRRDPNCTSSCALQNPTFVLATP